jgi:hypothetical protein
MRQISILLVIITGLFSCNKDKQKNQGQCIGYMEITAATTPKVTTVNTGITMLIQGYGYNSCFKFTETEVMLKGANSFEIKLKSEVPCGPSSCADVLVGVRDTLTINTPKAGTYYLKYINGPSLFKTDTVVVN